MADRHAGGDGDDVADLHAAGLDGGAHGLGVQLGARVDALDEGGHDAPGHGHAVIGLLVVGGADDDGARAERGDGVSGRARLGDGDDALGAEVGRGGAGGVGDGVGLALALHVHLLELVAGDAAAVIVDLGLGVGGDERHGADGLDRVLADRGLAREHDGRGAVKDGVCHVGDLGAGGARVFGHGVEHLGGGDDALALGDGHLDQVLLDLGQLVVGHLDAEVAARDHEARALGEDLADVVDALHVLDLGDDLHVLLAVLLEDVLDVEDVLLGAGKGGGDEVDALLQAEDDVGAVLVRDEGHVELDAGDVDGLAVGERAGVERAADDVGAVLDLLHLEGDEAVVDEDAGAGLYVVRQAGVGDGDDALVALDVAGGQGKGLAVLDLDLAVFIGLGPDLRALCVKHDANGQAELCAAGLDLVHTLLMLLVRAVAEVQAGDVHARLHHALEHLVVVGRRAERTDDFRSAHHNRSTSLHDKQIRGKLVFDYNCNLTYSIILPPYLQCIPEAVRMQSFIFSTLLKNSRLFLGQFVNFALYALAACVHFQYNIDTF